LVRADFCRLPFPDGFCNLIVAAFCLYHARSPTKVIAEMARCLVPGGTAIIAVKAGDSYRELDQLISRSGLDPAAESRPSLYQAAHSGNIELLAATSLDVREVIHETHQFVFPILTAVAGYLSTSPKYDLPLSLTGHPAALAAALRERAPDEPVTATSVVTYLSAIRAPAAAAP
jgi:SAM-dependent methyltransferase